MMQERNGQIGKGALREKTPVKLVFFICSIDELMEAAKTAGERRAILQAIGPVAKLAERKIGTDQNGRVLTVKYIEVEPYPWLEK